MKLYATVTSERASKGQGGNEYLEIEVRGERQKVIFEFRVQAYEDCYEIEGYSIDETSVESKKSERYFAFRPTKGKRQNGEMCMYNHEHGKDCITHN